MFWNRRRRSKSHRNNPAQQVSVVARVGPDGELTTTVEILRPEEVETYKRYFEAHKLLPQDFSSQDWERRLAAAEESARTLSLAPSATELDLERAIVVLGHVPVDASVRALSIFIESRHALAGMAQLALGECASMKAVAQPGSVS